MRKIDGFLGALLFRRVGFLGAPGRQNVLSQESERLVHLVGLLSGGRATHRPSTPGTRRSTPSPDVFARHLTAPRRPVACQGRTLRRVAGHLCVRTPLGTGWTLESRTSGTRFSTPAPKVSASEFTHPVPPADDRALVTLNVAFGVLDLKTQDSGTTHPSSERGGVRGGVTIRSQDGRPHRPSPATGPRVRCYSGCRPLFLVPDPALQGRRRDLTRLPSGP